MSKGEVVVLIELALVESFVCIHPYGAGPGGRRGCPPRTRTPLGEAPGLATLSITKINIPSGTYSPLPLLESDGASGLQLAALLCYYVLSAAECARTLHQTSPPWWPPQRAPHRPEPHRTSLRWQRRRRRRTPRAQTHWASPRWQLQTGRLP